MKPISPGLLAKLNKNVQSKYNDADPRINLVFQRHHRYIKQGEMMQPFTLTDGEFFDVGPWDLALRKPDRKKGPDYIYRAHIQGGQVYVFRVNYLSFIAGLTGEPGILDLAWEFTSLAGEPGAVDCAIEFDGHWQRAAKDAEICFDSPANWMHVTESEPYVFWITSTGALKAQKLGGSVVQLAPSGVTKLSAIRGWKSVIIPDRDQGLIVAYICDGYLKYRNFAEQADNQKIWESEKDTGEQAVDVGVSRTNDFRAALLYETPGGEIHWLITGRNWAGMGIPPENIEANIRDYNINLQAINYIDEFAAEKLSASITDYETKFCPAIYPEVVSISNPDEEGIRYYFLSSSFPAEFTVMIPSLTTIVIVCSLPLYGNLEGLQEAFTVTDDNSTPFNVTATGKGNDLEIVLTVDNFTLAQGELTINYIHNNGPIFTEVEGGCLMELKNFSESFTPEIDYEPLTWISQEIISASVTNYEIDLITITHKPYNPAETISAAIVDYEIDLIHVDQIDP